MRSKPCRVCEGPTDTAAAIQAGYFALGRPACLGEEKMLRQMLRNLGIKEIVLCADMDEPGKRGANKLIFALDGVRVRRLRFPGKDLREWLGGMGAERATHKMR